MTCTRCYTPEEREIDRRATYATRQAETLDRAHARAVDGEILTLLETVIKALRSPLITRAEKSSFIVETVRETADELEMLERARAVQERLAQEEFLERFGLIALD